MGGLSRRTREKRAYTLGLVAAGSGAATIALFVVALVTSLSMGLPFLTLVIAAIAGLLFRSTVRG